MSLEERLDALTTALNRNSDLLEGLTAKAKAGAAAAADKGDDKPARGKDKDDDKPARGKGKATKEKAPTVAEMKKLAEDYLDVSDEDEYNERRTLIRAIVDHFGAEKFTAIESKDRLVASKLVSMAADGENVDPEDIAGAIEELDGGSNDEAEKPSRRRSDDI
ncbi:hypothetical protein [Neoaquamicrobium sediminum]|uniref:hypothetical protein n=1 Tax=Neoaquamicrobium sediminum TaxID=1849104 RepID=UPI0015647B0E|nr:hypothetical protein [Mesorhizobium sediminum]NRC54192.1 hypothetical protein [Mesorhizobium sediminum]